MENNNAVAVFISGSKISCDENGLYSLNDLHKASGGEKRHRPNYWLNLESTKEVLEEISKKTDAVITATKRGGKDQGTFVNDILLSMYASWISPKMHIRVYEIFTQTIKERAKALEQENKKLVDFKDDFYRNNLANKHLLRSYGKLSDDVVKGINIIINTFKWKKKVYLSDLMNLSLISHKASSEALEYAKRNIIAPIDDNIPADKQEVTLR